MNSLKVKYIPNGVSVDVLRGNLKRMVEMAVGEGMLTGDTNAETDHWTMSIKRVGD